MMNLMVDGVKKEGIQLPSEPTEVPKKEMAKEGVKQKGSPRDKAVQREKSRARKSLDGSLWRPFLKSHAMTKRGDKSIYIPQEYHERLSSIVRVIGFQ